ncbi:hypothetical protein [Streptomyces ficellus]|uniref:Extensin n=1 Tax=Streptomyces ficellus TaxID=1977088 RepID=A0A6I6F5I9_9ACTN|nr:hypothetical protein [Streptomyces ficellus]QGV78920.1 hypothetical protein EIZ62_12180 [Streptomyces ficellus]
MADERDEWLDHDAAENLLRGEPVGPVADHARERARKVERALDALRATAHPAAGGLPGEEAALAAFRQARAEKAAGAAAAGAAATGTAGAATASGGAGVAGVPEVGTVRTRPGPRRRMRWGRPVRWGLAASVAGLAVGGVAVGAGTGVLPVLGGDSEPLPAASVSAAASDEPEAAGPTGGTDAGTPGTPEEPGAVPPSASATPGPGTDREPGRPDPEGSGDSGTTGGTVGEPGGDLGEVTGGGSGSASAGVSGSSGDGRGDTWLARTAQDCRDYRDGRLDLDRRERLADEAKGVALIKILCDRVLAAEEHQQGGSPGSGSSGSGGGAPGGGGHGTGAGGGSGGDGEGRGDGDGSDTARPSASWRPLAPALTVRRTGLAF